MTGAFTEFLARTGYNEAQWRKEAFEWNQRRMTMTYAKSVFRNLLRRAAVLLCVAVSNPLLAADVVVTRYFSGLWDQPKQEHQGIVLQVVESDPDMKRAVGYWFTYGEDRESAWYIGIGHVEGPQVLLDMYVVSGVGFMEDAMPDFDPVESVGSMVLSFHNCNHGMASYEFGGGEHGEFEISKLAGLYNARCSGGISDDTPAHARPMQYEVELLPARDGVSGKGKAKFWERADRSDFHVSAEDIADGDYDILVCDEPVGVLPVAGGYGQTQYRSPESDSKLLLTFDPRDCEIALHDGEGAVLSSGAEVLAPKTPPAHGHDKGMTEMTALMESTGAIPGAEGEVKFEIKMNSIEFEIEIGNVPAGSYAVDVGGVEQGQIPVNPSGKGKLRFSDPQKEDWLALAFDPRGLLIEVRSGVDVILEVFFPEE